MGTGNLFDEGVLLVTKKVTKAEFEKIYPQSVGCFPEKSADICQNRHRGAAESVEAYERNKGGFEHSKERIAEIIEKSGSNGITADAIVYDFGIPLQTVSARMSELKRENRIVKIGRRNTRTGNSAGIYVLWCNKPIEK
jgi:predicted Rossmann fold nucleotide-binding protein DprA/Smf involved in DNA uptake